MIEGILPLNKPVGCTSFSLISLLRRLTKVKKIGHTGTLDPFASGVMILLIGQNYTRQADRFFCESKEYEATLHLGIQTDSYDVDGMIVDRSSLIPTPEKVDAALLAFQGTLSQIPPMFSAKKVKGKRLYELARKGITIERQPALVHVQITLLSYTYPFLKFRAHCSKGFYIRSLGHDIGQYLGCGAHVCELIRIRNGRYALADCCDGALLSDPNYAWQASLQQFLCK